MVNNPSRFKNIFRQLSGSSTDQGISFSSSCGETDSPLANRYQIAGAIIPSSYFFHHSAMEYYGVSDQIFYEIYVSSNWIIKGVLSDMQR